MARLQVNQVRCLATAVSAPEKMNIQIITDIPPQFAYGMTQLYSNGAVQQIGQTLTFDKQMLILLVVNTPGGDIPFIPYVITAYEVPGPTTLRMFFSQQGGPGAYCLSFQMLPAQPPPSTNPSTPTGAPSTSQLNRIGQAIVEALATTFTVIPIGDKGSITADKVQYDSNAHSIDFHVTIHYKQSGAPGFLGQIAPSLYDFTTFYQGSISMADPKGSVENTQYGFSTPNIPGIGVKTIGLDAGDLVALAQIIGEILA